MHYWSHLTKEEISTLISQGVTTAILPFGSTEQHGPQLMTGNDYLFAERLAIDLAEEMKSIITQGLHVITPNGILGDARKSSKELGKRFYDALLDIYIKFYREKGLTTN